MEAWQRAMGPFGRLYI